MSPFVSTLAGPAYSMVMLTGPLLDCERKFKILQKTLKLLTSNVVVIRISKCG